MKYTKFSIVLCTLIATTLVGCKGDDESVQHYDNKVFISAKSYSSEVRIEENVSEMSRKVIIGVAKPEGSEISATFREAPELLDTYRAAYYDPEALLLPEGHCDLSQAVAIIKQGRVESDPLTLNFVGLDQLNLEERYVLPVTIASVDGPSVLNSARTLYFLFKEASLVNVVGDINANWAWPAWKNATPVTDMETFTLEALVFGYAFNNKSSVSTIMGIEDLFLVRVGDTTIPKNQIQVAYAVKKEDTTERGTVTSSALALQTNRWYHISVTFDQGEIKVYLDGKEKASGNSSEKGITSVNFGVPHSDEADGKPRCFWVGYSYDKERYLNGMISEVRIWNKALTAEQINAENHFYKVDPASEGLVSYWKFDDGEGKAIKDHTTFGNDLTADHDLKWVPVELPKKNK